MCALRRIPDEEYEARPSKSELKRQVTALQELGKQLAQVAPDRLRAIDAEVHLPAGLLDELIEYQTITAHEAKRRKMQLIGKLMRDVEDVEPIKNALEAVHEPQQKETEQLHRIEQLREDLLEGGPPAMARVMEEFPAAEPQKLGQLVRAAKKERAAGKPPKQYRQLFQYLKELEASG